MREILPYLPKLPGIYKWTNKINGKVYIGKAVNLWGRLRSYLSHARKPNKEICQISRAHKKYGFENFQLDLLEVFPQRNKFIEEYILTREKFWIEFYRSTKTEFGYNTTLFGTDRTGLSPSADTREKIRKSLLGKKRSNESRERMSQAGLGRKLSEDWKKNIAKGGMGKVKSAETRRKISQANSKAIHQIDLKTGEIIATYSSITEAQKLFGKNGASITKVLAGQRFKAYGFKWEYVDPQKDLLTGDKTPATIDSR